MYICVMDRQGKKLVHTNVKDNDFAFFLKLVQPYRHDLIGVSRHHHLSLSNGRLRIIESRRSIG